MASNPWQTKKIDLVHTIAQFQRHYDWTSLKLLRSKVQSTRTRPTGQCGRYKLRQIYEFRSMLGLNLTRWQFEKALFVLWRPTHVHVHVSLV